MAPSYHIGVGFVGDGSSAQARLHYLQGKKFDGQPLIAFTALCRINETIATGHAVPGRDEVDVTCKVCQRILRRARLERRRVR